MKGAFKWHLIMLSALGLTLACGGGGRGTSTGGGTNPVSGLTIASVYEQTISSLRAGHPDTDGDGIPDDVELTVLHTNPNAVDSDGDGIPDNLEVFGTKTWGPTDLVPDANKNGTIAALDRDDNGDGVMDGDLVDSDGDGIPDYMELYGYTWDALTAKPKLWNGDHSARYFKSDPYQRSTDQDPFDDLTEVSGVNMDVSVKSPGDLPMVPALPEVVVRMEGYRVTLKKAITVTQGRTVEEGATWDSTATASHSRTREDNWEVGVSASVGFTFPGVSATVDVHANYGGSISNTNETSNAVSQGGSRVTSQEWSQATTTDPTQAAQLKLFLKVYNQGTACASNVVPTLALRIGGHNIATFQPGQSQINLLEPGGTYPSTPGVFWVVDTTQNGTPIYLTLNELRALECGAPVSLTMTQMAADVMRLNKSTGAYESLGDWNEYMVRCRAVCADLYFDAGDGNFIHSLVYADGRPTAPRVTLGDAFLWGAGGTATNGLGFTYQGTDGLPKMLNLENWTVCVDGGTYTANGLVKGAALPTAFNAFDLRLNPNSVIIARAPRPTVPNGQTIESDIFYAFYDSSSGSVNAVVDDYNGVTKVEFIDSQGTARAMARDLVGSDFFVYYPQADALSYPNGYTFKGTEGIRVTNIKGTVRDRPLTGIYVTPAPVKPTIEWAVIDNVSIAGKPFLETQITEGVNAPIDWVKLFFPDDPSYPVIELGKVVDDYKRPFVWTCDLTGVPESVWARMLLVAHTENALYSEKKGGFTVEKPYLMGDQYLHAYYGWYWDDDWSQNTLDLDANLLGAFGWEEGDAIPWPAERYDLFPWWMDGVWQLYMYNIPSVKVTDLPYDQITKNHAADYLSHAMGVSQRYTIQAGDVYVVRTSSGRLAKVLISEYTPYDPSGAYNRAAWTRVKFMVFKNATD